MRIVLYTNIMTPYRKYFYDLMYNECLVHKDEFYVLLMAETENNRSWKFMDFNVPYATVLPGKTISKGETYIHINYGLKKHIEAIRPDIIIDSGSYICPGTWQLAKWKKELGYKILFWSESHLGEQRDYGGIKIAIREYMRNHFYKKFDGFLYPGKKALEFIHTYGGTQKKEIFLPNLINEKIFLKNKKCDFSSVVKGKTTFFCPARLSPVKGIGNFFILLAQCPNKDKARIIIAGDGTLKNSLKNMAKKFKIDAEFLGSKTQDEVAVLYSQADIFLLPSLSDPNPLSCIEAAWVGLPLLVSDHVGNYPEIVKQGVNGFVFSYEEPQKAIKYITNIIDKDSLWRESANQVSGEIAASIYDSHAVVKRVLKQLSDLI